MLRVEGLSKAFIAEEGNVNAVRQVSFEVKTGEFFALLGPSGCGKTTTLRCIAGLEDPDEGEIWIDNKPVFSSTRDVAVPVYKREIGMVFQSYAVWPHMSVAQNVGYPLVHGRVKVSSRELEKRVKEVLHLVQLDKLENRPASLLSGGQQQRVALARALVAEPKLLLMDEPLSNLDAKLRVEMRQELRDLFERLKLTGLYVTHDQEEALVLSDRIAVMHGGQIMQVGPPSEIYKEPANLFVAGFVGKTNLSKGRVNTKDSTDSVTIVDTPLGKLACLVPEEIAEGREVLVMFRPEAVTIHRGECNGQGNLFAGIVNNVVFTGNRLELDIQVGESLVRVESSPYLEEICKGQNVCLEIPADRIRVLPT